MGYEINEVLQRLEKNLKAVESARNQVTAVVNSNKELQDCFRNFASSLAIMQEHLKGVVVEITAFQNAKIADVEDIVSRMETSSQELLSLFKTQSGEVVSDFKVRMTTSLEKLDLEVNNLGTFIKDLKEQREAIDDATKAIQTVETKLDKISSDLNNSQQEQDATLTAITVSVNSIPVELLSLRNEFVANSKRVLSQVSDLQDSLEAIVKKSRKDLVINRILLIIILVVVFGGLFLSFYQMSNLL